MTEDARERFYRIVPELLREDQRLALVLAEIGVSQLDVGATQAGRVFNVGIREQLMIGVAGGLALTGFRPVVHSFAPFLIERPFEQVKLDLGHQGVGAVLVSCGASYGWPEGGETHYGHRDVGLLDLLDGWTVHVPGTADEAEALLRASLPGDDKVYLRLDKDGNSRSYGKVDGRLTLLRKGSRGTVIAVGPMADRTLRATEGLDVTVLYANTVRPFDSQTLLRTLTEPDVAIVEPYLRGTSVNTVATALVGVRHRVLGLGVDVAESRRYGTLGDHLRIDGLDDASMRRSLTTFLRADSDT